MSMRVSVLKSKVFGIARIRVSIALKYWKGDMVE